ncbi:MAG: twin-arginine translocase subunit TatC [Desulfatibacillaceae bacterium]
MSNEEELDKAPFLEHLTELRDRLIKCFVAVAIGFGICYLFKERLFEVLMMPLIDAMGENRKELIYTGLPEMFFTYLKVSLLGGIALAMPVIMFQLWRFVGPGLYQKERRILVPAVFLSTVFFLGGALFGYFIVFPYGFEFFLGFSTEYISPQLKVNEYLSFTSKLLLAFGLVFELPLFITILARMGLVTPAFLKKHRKYAILLFFIGSALLTPPDVVTQVMMAMPLLVLYELSIVAARIFGRKPLTASDEDEIEEEAAREGSS